MISVILTRNLSLSDDQGTYGRIKAPGFECVTLERPRASVVTHPAIPVGIYDSRVVTSPTFYSKNVDYGYGRGQLYGIDVPSRSGILIHVANWAIPIHADYEEYHYQLLGCIALGTSYGKIQAPSPDGRMLKGISGSKPAILSFYRIMDKQPFKLTVLEV